MTTIPEHRYLFQPSTDEPQKPRALIVDDTHAVRTRFAQTLENEGIETATVANGLEALDQFSTFLPDIVLLDLLMPGLDGFDVCREIRALSQGKHTPVLIITGSDNIEFIHRAFEAGATDFAPKTIPLELLVYRVRCLLRNAQLLHRLQLSEERLLHAQRLASLGHWEWYPGTGAFHHSSEVSRILGMPEHAFASFETLLNAISPADRDMVRETLTFALTSVSGTDFECCIVRPDGSECVVWIYAMSHPAEFACPAYLTGILQDVTEKRRTEDRCRMLKEAVDSLQIGITFANPSGEMIYVNPAAAHMHGYQVGDLLGREAKELAPSSWQIQRPATDLSQAKPWRRESVDVRRNGDEFPVLLTSISVQDREMRYLGVVTTCEDISEQKKVSAKINQLAYFDNLTDLPNRVTFLERLQQSLALASLSGEQVCLIFIDLDNFKDVNDTLGHAEGDKLLTEVSRRLESCVRESDLLARIGGDEFVILLCSGVTQEGSVAVAQRVLHQLTVPFHIDKCTVYTGASIGIAFFPDDSSDASSLFRCADTAMYHAKNEGKSRFRLYSTEMNTKIKRRIAVENSLRRALERGEFHLHYQPQWDLKSEKMVGAEVLLRWNSAELGSVSPSEFIPVVENSGLIFSIGEWVLKNACQQGRRLVDAGFDDFRIAVNISGKQLKQPDFVQMVINILDDTGMRPGNLELEFTESVIMEPAGKSQEKLSALKEIGVQTSIDDFGTGYSSLNYLKHLPVDRIKIDRSFVVDVNSGEGDAAIVEAIISMAKSLRLKVLAEGVENNDQLRFLSDLGCDEVQGFYFAEPMPPTDLTETLHLERQHVLKPVAAL
ncbi:MAG TPA: EAL domain-containing protein [Geomonas sp.]|nr:EAL domain-containing protein [Geomonas sp.]